MSKFSSILLLVCLVALPVWAQKGPKIRASETGWNFGERVQGEKDIKIVQIFNDGDAPLKINDIKLTCGCVRGDMKVREIAPGESAELELTLTTLRSVGLIRKHCYVYSNDPKLPQLIMTVEGNIKGDWSLEQTQVLYGECEAGMEYTQTFRVLRRPGLKIGLTSIETLDPNLKISAKEFDDPEAGEAGWIVTMTLLETTPAGPFAAAVAVRTDHKLTPLQNVMVYAKLNGPVKTQPMSQIHMGRVFEGAEARRNLRITIDDGAGYVVTGVQVECPAVEVRITELDPGVVWDVEFIVTGRTGDKNMNETILISTSHPLQRQVKMALNWVTKPPLDAKQR